MATNYAKIVRGFTKVLSQLEKYSEECLGQMSSIRSEISSLESEYDAQSVEQKKAQNTINKFNEIFG